MVIRSNFYYCERHSGAIYRATPNAIRVGSYKVVGKVFWLYYGVGTVDSNTVSSMVILFHEAGITSPDDSKAVFKEDFLDDYSSTKRL